MSLRLTDEVKGQSISLIPACNQAGSSEVSLVAAAKCGDATAFEELVQRHQRRLRHVAQRITHNREDAEDVVQGSLLQAFVHLGSLRGDSQFSAWLTRIVTNEALLNQRKERRKKEVPLDESGEAEGALVHSEVADSGFSPEEDYSHRELQQILTDMIEELKPNSRIVFQLRHLEQLSTNATAQILNLPVSTVKTRIRRARLELRQVLKRHFQTSAEQSLIGLWTSTSSEELAASSVAPGDLVNRVEIYKRSANTSEQQALI